MKKSGFILTCIALICIFEIELSWASHCTDVTRSEWGARKPSEKIDSVRTPVKYVIICHTGDGKCNSFTSCSELLKAIQRYHMDTMHFSDIGYNFLVGSDGRIYEGRGFGKEGAHTRGYNDNSIGIAFIGNYNRYAPNRKQINAVQDFLECAVDYHELSRKYILYGARDVTETESPGDELYEVIQDWDHYQKPEQDH